MKKRNDSCKKCPSYNNAYAARYMRDNFFVKFAIFVVEATSGRPRAFAERPYGLAW